MRRLRDVTNAHEELRYLDKSTGDEETKNILLDLDSESSYYTILRQVCVIKYVWISINSL